MPGSQAKEEWGWALRTFFFLRLDHWFSTSAAHLEAPGCFTNPGVLAPPAEILI